MRHLTVVVLFVACAAPTTDFSDSDKRSWIEYKSFTVRPSGLVALDATTLMAQQTPIEMVASQSGDGTNEHLVIETTEVIVRLPAGRKAVEISINDGWALDTLTTYYGFTVEMRREGVDEWVPLIPESVPNKPHYTKFIIDRQAGTIGGSWRTYHAPSYWFFDQDRTLTEDMVVPFEGLPGPDQVTELRILVAPVERAYWDIGSGLVGGPLDYERTLTLRGLDAELPFENVRLDHDIIDQATEERVQQVSGLTKQGVSLVMHARSRSGDKQSTTSIEVNRNGETIWRGRFDVSEEDGVSTSVDRSSVELSGGLGKELAYLTHFLEGQTMSALRRDQASVTTSDARGCVAGAAVYSLAGLAIGAMVFVGAVPIGVWGGITSVGAGIIELALLDAIIVALEAIAIFVFVNTLQCATESLQSAFGAIVGDESVSTFAFSDR